MLEDKERNLEVVADNSQNVEDYDSHSIEVLGKMEAVRVNATLYIDSTSGEGLNHLVWEIIDNSIDESLAGQCNLIKVWMGSNEEITVIDNGRGIPIKIHRDTGVSATETILTTLHAGAKYKSKAYKVSGGQYGVGASVVNALSSFFEVTVKRDKKKYFQRFEKGVPQKAIIVNDDSSFTGTKIKFRPDFSLFDPGVKFDKQAIIDRLERTAFLNANLRIEFTDESDNLTKIFHYQGGLKEYLEMVEKKEGCVPLFEEIIVVKDRVGEYVIDIAFRYNINQKMSIMSFCNNIHTTEGGSHEEGFINGLRNALNRYANEHGFLKDEDKFTVNDIKVGLTSLVSVLVPGRPQYEGQTKKKLRGLEIRRAVYNLVSGEVSDFLLRNPEVGEKIVKNVVAVMKSRLAAQKIRKLTYEQVFSEGSFQLPGKLASCTTKDPEKAEIFIVEGDSAGGSAKMARDRFYQAVLPIRGKLINSEKINILKVLESNTVIDIISALGCGIGESFRLEKLRYHKIIIMTDADDDGDHIKVLLLAFFYKFFPQLVENGYVYVARPPLFSISYRERIWYYWKKKELHLGINDLVVREGKIGKSLLIRRYKGVGEMNFDQLKETTMDSAARILIRMTARDKEELMEASRIFNILMGEDVKIRRDFIMKRI